MILQQNLTGWLSQEPAWADIERAHNRIKPIIVHTPVITSDRLNRELGCEIFLKCENFQRIHAFKARGATNAIFALREEAAARGVVTHSSGNHASAVAMAAQRRGIPAHIVMPQTARAAKKALVREHGGIIYECAPNARAREEMADLIVERTGAILVHPFDNWDVIAGQATAAVELLRDVPDLDVIITPVGGGGLLAGCAIAVQAMSQRTEVWAAEPAGADDAARSLATGSRVVEGALASVADGLLTYLGERTFSVISRLVSGIAVVDDDQIIDATRRIWDRVKIVVEPSCATPIAAIAAGKVPVAGKRVGIILTGGNVDLDDIPWLGHRSA
jgi:threonine dehydratase